jgi:hypothetical protein
MGISSFGISFYIILALSVTTAGLGWLSLSLHDDKVVAEQALSQVININTEMQKSLNLKDLSCKIDDSVSSEYYKEKNTSDILKDKELSSIDKIPSRPPAQTPLKVPHESNIIDIDGSLPDDLQRVLSESYKRTTGSAASNTGQSSN